MSKPGQLTEIVHIDLEADF